MKTLTSFRKYPYRWWLILACLIPLTQYTAANAQVCADPANVMYGLSNSGFIYPVTVSSGAIGPQLNPAYTGNTPLQSNGLGYSQLNGKFYYFKRPPGSSPQEFVSFDPATNAYSILASCPTTKTVYVGCMTPNGLAYYCWDTDGTIFYYNVTTNTWKTITAVIRDQAGNDVNAIIKAHGSGDIAADGTGNLYMLPSSNSRYSLYRLNTPLPTNPVASITVTEIVPPTNPPTKFGGIALNATGQIILSATAPNNKLYRLESNLTLTLISTLASDMGDLTSCNFPLFILTSLFKDFSASLKGGATYLQWNSTSAGSSCIVQHSLEGNSWNDVGSVNDNATIMQFTHLNPAPGKNYYRLKISNQNGDNLYSETRIVIREQLNENLLWPNPAANILHIEQQGKWNRPLKAIIYQLSGQKLKEVFISGDVATIDLRDVKKGVYLLRLEAATGSHSFHKFVKE